MEILDSYEIDNENKLYAVALEEGFLVDVKVNVQTGLIYIMQNEDGSTVYNQAFADYTFPNYEYDEHAVIDFIKSACEIADKKEVKPTLNKMMANASTRVKDQARQMMNEMDKQISFSELKR